MIGRGSEPAAGGMRGGSDDKEGKNGGVVVLGKGGSDV